MTYLEVYQSFVNRFLDNWVDTEIELEGSKIDVDQLDEFVRLQIFNDDSSNFSHGPIPRRLLTGNAIIEVYSRRGKGVGRLLTLVDNCSAIFSNVKLNNGIKFYATEVIDRQQMISGETVVDPNWISKSVIAKFKAPL
jgi:hypothetical protein